MNTWDDLRELRKNGLRPSMPVVITTDGRQPARILGDEGCLVIHHEPGKQFPVELLEGLRVWLFLGSCDRASAVVRAMVARGTKPAHIGSWCVCAQVMDYQPVRCEVAKQWQ